MPGRSTRVQVSFKAGSGLSPHQPQGLAAQSPARRARNCPTGLGYRSVPWDVREAKPKSILFLSKSLGTALAARLAVSNFSSAPAEEGRDWFCQTKHIPAAAPQEKKQPLKSSV